ncbi:MAG TPA: HEAT repeat domain-containing protein [Pedobacter sp.]|jgi:hypothetical protein
MLTAQHLLLVTISLTVLMLVLLAYMCISLVRQNKSDKKKTRWLAKTNVLITKAIFFEEDEQTPFSININRRIKELLTKPLFRKLLIDELVASSNNLAGVASENLSKLYTQLGLRKDCERNLRSSKWHIKAMAIKQLATMHLDDFPSELFNLTTHKNEYIRMEAQTSIVKYHGFEGLEFLNHIKYPISEWHQLNLLKELSNIPSGDFKGIENWLQSSNDTVIIFALKLSASYHQFQLYDQIVECLKHENQKVRLQCIKCLKEIYEDTTAAQLIKIYNNEPKAHQLAILSALKEIASTDSLSFLKRQLSSEDDQIKIAATRALFKCGPEGEEIVYQHHSAARYPLLEIIQQVKMECT